MTRLTSEEAARIAKTNGLGLNDAAALRMLTDSTEEAEKIAAQFAAEQDPAAMAQAVHDKLNGR